MERYLKLWQDSCCVPCHFPHPQRSGPIPDGTSFIWIGDSTQRKLFASAQFLLTSPHFTSPLSHLIPFRSRPHAMSWLRLQAQLTDFASEYLSTLMRVHFTDHHSHCRAAQVREWEARSKARAHEHELARSRHRRRSPPRTWLLLSHKAIINVNPKSTKYVIHQYTSEAPRPRVRLKKTVTSRLLLQSRLQLRYHYAVNQDALGRFRVMMTSPTSSSSSARLDPHRIDTCLSRISHEANKPSLRTHCGTNTPIQSPGGHTWRQVRGSTRRGSTNVLTSGQRTTDRSQRT